MQIVILDGYTLNPGDLEWSGFNALGNCTIYDRTSPDQLIERSKDAELIITNKVVIDAETMAKLPKLKYIGVLATGYNVIDLNAATQKGIVVTNIPAYSTRSVAQLVFSFILNFAQKVQVHSDEVKAGKWVNCKDFHFTLTPQVELVDKILGIVGFGQIGQSVAKLGLAFGMKVIFFNPGNKEGLLEGAKQVSLHELFEIADFISLNCPLTAQNKEFVNSSLLSMMKPSSYLINTGRGPLINESDLARALNSESIAGAGLDVLSTEPPKGDNPLLSAKNCIITPHMAWATFEARKRLMSIAVENIKAFLVKRPLNQVNI